MKQSSDPLDGQFTYQILPSEKLCLIVATGSINYESSVNALYSLAEKPGFEKEFNILADLRSIDYHPSYLEILKFHKNMVFMKDHFKGKIAIVTTNFFWVVGELVTQLSRPYGFNILAFRDMDEADAWIAENSNS